MRTQMQPRESLWKVRDLARYANVAERTVYNWVARGDSPPYLKAGKSLRFVPAECEKWFRNRAENE